MGNRERDRERENGMVLLMFWGIALLLFEDGSILPIYALKRTTVTVCLTKQDHFSPDFMLQRSHTEAVTIFICLHSFLPAIRSPSQVQVRHTVCWLAVAQEVEHVVCQ